MLGAIGVLLVIAVGCGAKEDDPPKGGDGVDDVKAACEIRAKWVRTGNDCSLCEASVPLPPCDCSSTAAFAGACVDQQDAQRRVCSDAINLCVFHCDATDCACVEACYAADDACKKASAARDGCIAEVCDKHCK
jgi:hypothetical protein